MRITAIFPAIAIAALTTSAAVLACSATENLGGDGDGGSFGEGGNPNDANGNTNGDGNANVNNDGSASGNDGGNTSLDGGGTGTDGSVTIGVGPGPKWVTGGQGFTCAITAAGAVKCWGEEFYGQLGNGTTADEYTSTPAATSTLTSGVTAISARFRHTCAIAAGGAVYCWGQSSEGATGTDDDTNVPSLVAGIGSGAVEIAAGYYHSCARDAGGAVKCWGGNLNHELGNDSVVGQTTTATDTTITGALAMAAGEAHTCVLLTTGVSCWGQDDQNQLGANATGDSAAPVVVPGTDGAIDIAAMDDTTCALNAAGAVKCWGAGVGPFTADTWTPAGLASLMPGGYTHICGLTPSGAIVCFGDNQEGEFGDGTANGSGPSGPVGLSFLSAVAAEEFTCATTPARGVMCFGLNDNYQLGDTRVAPAQYTPQLVVGF